MEEVVVIGGGGHAKVVISLLKKMGSFCVLGYLDKTEGPEILGVPYAGTDERLIDIKMNHPKAAAALGIGSVEISDLRPRLMQKLESLGYSFPVLISPTAVVNEDVKIGRGAVILDGAVINPGTTIGEFSIINTGSTIDHDCELGEFVHVAPGATVCGGVRVGRNAILGAGCSVIQYRYIGENCLIGAGATVVEDCEDAGVYVGSPARKRQADYVL